MYTMAPVQALPYLHRFFRRVVYDTYPRQKTISEAVSSCRERNRLSSLNLEGVKAWLYFCMYTCAGEVSVKSELFALKSSGFALLVL